MYLKGRMRIRLNLDAAAIFSTSFNFSMNVFFVMCSLKLLVHFPATSRIEDIAFKNDTLLFCQI